MMKPSGTSRWGVELLASHFTSLLVQFHCPGTSDTDTEGVVPQLAQSSLHEVPHVGLHLPPEKFEENGECCVWGSSGVALWPLVLFTAQFLLGPFGFSFCPHAWQCIYSGFVHLHAYMCSLVKKCIKNRLKIFLYRPAYHAAVPLN